MLNEFAENGNNPHQSGIDIYLKNGGLWENRWIGTERAAAVQKRENKDSYLYTGSKVRKLIGGASEAERESSIKKKTSLLRLKIITDMKWYIMTTALMEILSGEILW